jgi:hypothetical protein
LSAAKILGCCACTAGESAKLASASQMKRNPPRIDDLVIEYVTGLN